METIKDLELFKDILGEDRINIIKDKICDLIVRNVERSLSENDYWIRNAFNISDMVEEARESIKPKIINILERKFEEFAQGYKVENNMKE